MERNSRIHVAGHTGLAGSALVRALRASELDLADACVHLMSVPKAAA